MTCGTTITLQKKAGRKSTEIATGVTVTPKTIMPAAWTFNWSNPWIFFPHLKNILDQSGNKIYHKNTHRCGGNTTVVNGRGVLRKLPARSILKIKMASCEGQIIRQFPLSCQFILIIFNPKEIL